MTFPSFAAPMAELPDSGAVARQALADRTHEAGWVAGIRAGDERAFDAMFEAHYAGLCLFAATIVGSDAVAEEVVQDTLLQIWRQRDRWHVSTTVAAYLYRAVRNRAIGHVRHEAVERRLQDRVGTGTAVPALGAHPTTPDAELQGAELAVAIERALSDLAPRCREAFLLRRQHGLSYAEIAEAMGIAPKTVEVQIGAALRALRAALREWLP
jgi:RNA polymerase sigma-70 factor (ECF subfamily)